MNYRLAVEDIEPDHWVTWVLDLPGCFSSAPTPEEAIALAPARISQYFTWLRSHRLHPTHMNRGRVEVELVETFQSYVSEGLYVVNAFFEEDRKPLTEEDVQGGLALLEATREDLQDVLDLIPEDTRTLALPGEIQGSIQGILEHLAWTEWWYFDRLDLAFEREDMPADVFEKLSRTREQTRTLLPTLIGDEQILVRSGESWSARKVLRRTLWHERDHTHHIEKLRSYV